MIIWRGRGFLVALIAFGCLVLTEFITRAYFHDDTYYQQHGWPKLAGFVVAAGIVWFLVSRPEPPVFAEKDQLFFVSVRYWPVALCAFGVLFYFLPATI